MDIFEKAALTERYFPKGVFFEEELVHNLMEHLTALNLKGMEE